MPGCVIRSQDSAHWRLADIRNRNATAFTQITIRIKFQEFQRPELAIVPSRNLIADLAWDTTPGGGKWGQALCRPAIEEYRSLINLGAFPHLSFKIGQQRIGTLVALMLARRKVEICHFQIILPPPVPRKSAPHVQHARGARKARAMHPG